MIWILRANKSHRISLTLFFFFLGIGAAIAQQVSPPGDPVPSATFEQLSALAASAREAGHTGDAIHLYHSALRIQPDWAEGLWYLGTLNYDSDHYPEAIAPLQHLVVLDPANGSAFVFLGLSEFEIKDYEHSLAHLELAQQHGFGDDPELANVATYHLALLFNWRGEFEKNLQLLGTTVAKSNAKPPDEIVAALGAALLRIPLFVTEIDPGNDALIQAAGEASALLKSGNAVAAANALRQLEAQYPKTPYLHYARAEALAVAGKNEQALQELAAEIKVSSSSSLPYIRMASLDLQLNHPKEALVSARKAVLLSPQSPAAHEILAHTLESVGEIQESAEQVAASEKMASTPVEIDTTQRKRYAPGRSNPGGSAPRQAARDIDNSDSFETLAQKAAAAQAAGQIDATLSYYQTALALRPSWEEGWRNLGTLDYASAHYTDAIPAFKSAVALNPHSGDSWALLGLSEFETQDYKNSLIHLERGRDLGFVGNPAAVQIAKYHLGMLLNQSGDFDRASELLSSETASGPLNERVKFALGMSLLRIPELPAEFNHDNERANDPLVRLAGETATLLYQSKYDEAFAGFERMLKINSDTSYLHYAYGCALASASRYDEAEEQLEKENKITPKSALSYLRRGAIALQLHHPENAAPLAQTALQLAPGSGEAHYLLGRSWLELGKTAESVKELETAREQSPNSPEVRFSLARAYAKAGQSDAAEHERAAFERLNALVEHQRSGAGNQAYGAIQNRNGIRAAEFSNSAPANSHPK
jgi:predicted Zn-dependent protease